jgi:oligoribonuclease
MMAWVDCETTGLDAHKDLLLEVGIIITDDFLNVLDRKSYSLYHAAARDRAGGYVQEMHDVSGLWSDCKTKGVAVAAAELWLLEWLTGYVEPDAAPMCGSTVHFDRAFLKVNMPKLEDHFHYRNIDVSTVKELARIWNKVAFDLRPDDEIKFHRVIPDIEASIAELHHYKRKFLVLT